MGRFLRKRKHNNKKLLLAEAKKGAKMRREANRSVHHATTQQINEIHRIKSDTYDKVMLIFDAAVHDALGFGFDRRHRLHKKITMQFKCLRAGLVTIEDISRILKEEADISFTDFDQLEHEDFVTQQKNKALAELEAVFLLSLLDEFCKKPWLKKAWRKAEKISEKLRKREITFDSLKANLEKRRIRRVAVA